jgi:hypothetical protein
VRRLGFGAFVVVASLTAAASCREPTALVLVLSTDVDCTTVARTQAELAIGSREAVAAGTGQNVGTGDCAAGRIGTLTVVPSEAGDTVAIEAYLSTRDARASTTCRVDPTDCIVARRVIGFVPHETLTLPIELSSKCLNVRCGAEQTCVDGACVSDRVNTRLCNAGVCGNETLPPADGGVGDGGNADGGALDASTDGAGCGDVQKDPKNCGACGFDCGGGECIAGACRLVTAAKIPDEPNELGCLTLTPSTGEVFWTRTKFSPVGVQRVKTTGGSPSPYFPGAVGVGIASNANVVAFTSGGGGSVSLRQCDPANAPSGCSVRTYSAIGLPQYVATKPNVDESSALNPTTITSTNPANDFSAQNAIGPLVANVQRSAFYQVTNLGPIITLFANPNSTGIGLTPPAPTAMAVDPVTDTIYVTHGAAIDRLVATAYVAAFIGPLPSTPLRLALEPAPSNYLYWSALEGNGNGTALYRTAAKGGAPIEKLYAFPLAVQCLVAGPDALYWLSAGVPYKGHK